MRFVYVVGAGPRPHAQVDSGSHAVQTARTMERLEPVLVAECPDAAERIAEALLG